MFALHVSVRLHEPLFGLRTEDGLGRSGSHSPRSGPTQEMGMCRCTGLRSPERVRCNVRSTTIPIENLAPLYAHHSFSFGHNVMPCHPIDRGEVTRLIHPFNSRGFTRQTEYLFTVVFKNRAVNHCRGNRFYAFQSYERDSRIGVYPKE